MRRNYPFLIRLAALWMIVTAACGPFQAATAVAVPTRARTSVPLPTVPPAASQAYPNPSGRVPTAQPGPLALTVLSPLDGDVVSSPQIQVSGTAAPNAVVSVNDDILIVGADGGFQSAVSLEDGPNLIEVIASNDAGDQASIELTVTYEP